MPCRLAYLAAASLSVLCIACVGPGVEYDAVGNTTKIKALKDKVSYAGLEDVTLDLLLAGKGKYPSQWTCQVSLEIVGPKDGPNILGEKPVLALGGRGHRRYNGHYSADTYGVGNGERRDNAVFFLDEGDESHIADDWCAISINDKEVVLDSSQRRKIKSALERARARTYDRR